VNDLALRIKKELKPFNSTSFLNNKKGRLRSRYINAYNHLLKDGVNLERDSDISAFIKLERYYEAGKAPRMIMGRNPKFNILYAQIIEPIEQAFFSLPQVANACDYLKCGEKFEKMVGEWFMENDMSKYESSQRMFALHLEHMVYSIVLQEHLDLLDHLFAYKIRKKGHTSTGINFDFNECRGSGDMDTSLGNGILNYIATQYFMVKNYCVDCTLTSCKEPGCRSYKFVLKGDDSYSSIPRFSEKYVNTYKFFGFDAKIIIRRTAEEVEFCSGHFLEYQPGKYIYVQKLQKLIESLTTCVNADAIKNGWVAQYYKSLGMMYKQLYRGVPIYSDIAEFLCSASDLGLNLNLIGSYNLTQAFQHSENKTFKTDASLTYVSMSMINKMDIAELNLISDWCKKTTLKFSPALSKRCNLKTPKLIEVPQVNFDLLNDQILSAEMPKAIHRYYLRLRHFRRKWF